MADFEVRKLIAALAVEGAGGITSYKDPVLLGAINSISINTIQKTIKMQVENNEIKETTATAVELEIGLAHISAEYKQKYLGAKPYLETGIQHTADQVPPSLGLGFSTKGWNPDPNGVVKTDKWTSWIVRNIKLSLVDEVAIENASPSSPEAEVPVIKLKGTGYLDGNDVFMTEQYFDTLDEAYQSALQYLSPQRNVRIDLGQDAEGHNVIHNLVGQIGQAINLRELDLQDPQNLGRQVVRIISRASRQPLDSIVPMLGTGLGTLVDLIVEWGEPPQNQEGENPNQGAGDNPNINNENNDNP